MRKAPVIIATFVAVLIAGVVFAYPARPDDDSAHGASDEPNEEPIKERREHSGEWEKDHSEETM